MSKHVRAAVAATVLAHAGLILHADDLTITSTRTTDGQATTSTSYFSATKFRTGDGDVDVISDRATGALTVIDHKARRYWQTQQAALTAVFKQVEGQTVPEPTVTKGSLAKTLGGYPTDHWIVTAGDWKYEVWTAPSLPLPPGYWESARAPFARTGASAPRFGKLYDALKQVTGFPLAHEFTYTIGGRSVVSSAESTAVVKGAIPAAAFEVPAQYAKEASRPASPLKGCTTCAKNRLVAPDGHRLTKEEILTNQTEVHCSQPGFAADPRCAGHPAVAAAAAAAADDDQSAEPAEGPLPDSAAPPSDEVDGSDAGSAEPAEGPDPDSAAPPSDEADGSEDVEPPPS